MKKGLKISLIIAAVLALLGVALMAVSFYMGLDFARLREEGMHYVVDDVSVNLGGGGLSLYDAGADSEYRADGRYTVPADGISDISIDWVAGDIEIEPYDGIEIVFSEKAKNGISEKTSLSWEAKGEELRIYFYHPDVSVTNCPSKDLTLKVPRALAESLDSLTVDTVSGSVEIEKLSPQNITVETTSAEVKLEDVRTGRFGANTASGRVEFSGTAEIVDVDTTSGDVELDMDALGEQIDVDTTSGKVKLSGTAEEIQIDTTSGKVGLSGKADKIRINTTSGEVELDMDALGDRVEVDTTSGDVLLEIPKNSGFTLDYDSTSGDLTSQAPMTSDGVCGDGACRMTVSTTSGDLRIEYDD